MSVWKSFLGKKKKVRQLPSWTSDVYVSEAMLKFKLFTYKLVYK